MQCLTPADAVHVDHGDAITGRQVGLKRAAGIIARHVLYGVHVDRSIGPLKPNPEARQRGE
jgi:hypothetical protein